MMFWRTIIFAIFFDRLQTQRAFQYFFSALFHFFRFLLCFSVPFSLALIAYLFLLPSCRVLSFINGSYYIFACGILYDVIVTHLMCREALLCYITTGDDVQVLGSLSVLATLLQTKGYIIGFFGLFPCFQFCFLINIWSSRIG